MSSLNAELTVIFGGGLAVLTVLGLGFEVLRARYGWEA